ncbi:MAG TPA: PEGA domain-containing protein [Bryobacteraceae bacterium]|nr:PEGA domain-containing protein [Bryobacteraceae bacterium]
MRRAIRFFLCLAALVAPAALSPLAAAPAARKTARSSDPFLSGEPFTLDQVIRLLKEDAIPLRRRKEAIENRGVAFPVSADTLTKLRAAGANEEILEVIKNKAKTVAAAPPPAPKPSPKGSLSVTCAPAECQITLNGTSIGSTASGTLQATGLTPGVWVVDFAKSGYVGRQATVAVDANKLAEVSATLTPSPATLQAYGAHLLAKVLKAFGGDTGIKTLGYVEATGSTTVWDADGHSVRWTLLMRNWPDRALFQVRSGKLMHEVLFEGSEFKASKNLKGDEALTLPTDFGTLRDHQLSALLALLQKPEFKVTANHLDPVPGEEFSLFAESGTEKISIGLNADYRPERVKIVTDTGIGSAMLTYSDYVQSGSSFYPKSMKVKPEGKEQGVEVQFDTVQLSPNLKDSDFKLRGRALFGWGN